MVTVNAAQNEVFDPYGKKKSPIIMNPYTFDLPTTTVDPATGTVSSSPGFTKGGTGTVSSSTSPFAGQSGGPITSGELLPYYREQLGTPTTIQPESLYDKFSGTKAATVSMPGKPTLVQGLGQDYFTAERERRKEALRNEFMSPFGKIPTVMSEASGKGLLGSGVGRKYVQELAINPFAQAYAGMERDVAQEQMQERSRVEEANAKLMSDYADRLLQAEGINVESKNKIMNNLMNLAQTDSTNAINAEIANNETMFNYNNLASKLASEEAKYLNDYQLKILEMEVAQWEAAEKIKLGWEENRLTEAELALRYP